MVHTIVTCCFPSALHPGGQRPAAAPPRLHIPSEEQPGARPQAMVLLLPSHLALPRRCQHRGTRGSRAHRPLSVFAQPRSPQRSPLRRWTVRGAHAAPERAPSARAAGPPPPAAATAARARALCGHGARHCHRQCICRRLSGRRCGGAVLSQRDAACGTTYPRSQAAARRYALQRRGLNVSSMMTTITTIVVVRL